jgi:hypothetical protein
VEGDRSPLALVERPWLEEDGFCDQVLADVMQVRAEFYLV